jgi:hypothetical protein
LPIYPAQDEGNLYKISYKYEEASSEISPWKPTVEQLQTLICKYRSVKAHPDNEDTLELSVFLWALNLNKNNRQIHSGFDALQNETDKFYFRNTVAIEALEKALDILKGKPV